jgi:hypothetical protein
MKPRCFQIRSQDNVATLIDDAAAGPVELVPDWGGEIVALEAISRGHKIALRDLAPNEPIIKFGARIGHATQSIRRGAWVHLHNLASDVDARSTTLDLHSGAPTDTASAYV